MELTTTEAQHRIEATEQLLAEMRAPTANGGVAVARAWWDGKYQQLDDRTPTEALAAGDEAAVRALIDEWYAASERTAEKLRSDPKAMARIDAKVAELHSRRSA